MNPGFWAGKVVLVTGHTGFKGAWLSLWLRKLGAKVIGYSLPPPTTPSLFQLARVAEMMDSVEGDIRDLEHLHAVFTRYRPEIVIHLAAQSLVRYSYRNPVETYSTNVLGTAHLLEAARQAESPRALLSVTSDKCYENREWVWGYREGEPLGGHDPYSSSKACAELVTAAYRQSYFSGSGGSVGTSIASARAGNVIGGGDWAEDRLIPDVIRAFLRDEAIMIRFPDAVRPWQHVLDPLAGYLLLIERMWDRKGGFDQAWNFGPSVSDAKPVRWIVERIIELWGGKARMEIDTSAQPHEAAMLSLDCSKARTRLGWQPGLGLEMALQWTVEWYMRYQRGDDMRGLTEDQIGRFQEIAFVH
jgi:CDP-glucose 4,6-dehydratase